MGRKRVIWARFRPVGPHLAPRSWLRVCEAAGLPAEAEPDFGAARRARARELAAEAGGVLLVTGSHYVLAPAREALGVGGTVWED